ncbi:DinB family protein [Desulfosporosinus sp. BG]|uniref:DinB family protein n=1 Tax=Desulfosporosinus sp. BG TaxID=1633135 RepID=UPI00083A04A4|nr:DinB family protein [Desulfosporosinus sp. BG]ODA38991.1 DinB family protein [Desulfosporosinus sp. BG]
MFLSLAAFLQDWEKEEESTQRMLDALTDDSLNQAVTAQDRTLGRIAWHLVTTIPEMMARTGLILESIDEDAPVPDTAQEISNSYREVSNIIATAVRAQWNDQTLLEKRDMYGESWVIGDTLKDLIDHQIHHRGQLTVLMRQAGLKVPGIYGPAKEDWAQFGMEPPQV